ncbi:hypothetical protein FGO68_gene5836 [Halteria grandinella]|uniref:Glutathione S-transferase n=1 Tax=Halteria grandinella TaxID=5974 RepID=A0A8J8NKJ7_HALGN|nr:hypothetical protein FGO68_gene5836 [Halteria grandinella]
MEQKDKHAITLYWNLLSQPSRTVKALLLVGNVPHNEEHIDLFAGQQHSAEFKTNINPRGLVPVIKDGDFAVSESNAIMKYLCSTQEGIPYHYWPKDANVRAHIDQFLEYQQNHFRPSLGGPFWKILGAKFFGRPFEEAELKQVIEIFWKELDTLEVYLGQHEGDFIVGKEPTIADIQLYSDFTLLYNAKLDQEFEDSTKYQSQGQSK